ncbi:hypothetical protein Droror1_Dr00007198 [Drosera rotundifolia]
MQTPNPNPNDGGAGVGSPTPGGSGAAGFGFPMIRRPLMSRTFKQLAIIQAAFGEEPLRSYCTRFVPPDLLPIVRRAQAEDNQSSRSDQFLSGCAKSDGEHHDMKEANEKEDSGNPGAVRREEVREDMITDESARVVFDTNISLDNTQMILDESSRLKAVESCSQAVADDSGRSDASTHVLNFQEQISDIEKFLVDESPDIGQLPRDYSDGSVTLSEAIPSFWNMNLLDDGSRQDEGCTRALEQCEEGTKVGEQAGVEQQNRMDIDNLVDSSEGLYYPYVSADDGEEEGEILGSAEVNDSFHDTLLEDSTPMRDEVVHAKSNSKHGSGEPVFTFNAQATQNKKGTGSRSYSLGMSDSEGKSKSIQVGERIGSNNESRPDMVARGEGKQVKAARKDGIQKSSNKTKLVALTKEVLNNPSSPINSSVILNKAVDGCANEEKDRLLMSKTSKSESRRPNQAFYSQDQLLNLRQVASIPEDILKIKHEMEAEIQGQHQNQADSGNKVMGVAGKEKGLAAVEDGGKIKQVAPKKVRNRGALSKEKKKQKERKRRAEKNKKLGVRRVKIQLPISKPKEPNVCRHYRMGRCHEGENCKFSHDVEPDTKSKPCSFFARQACMKGDKCPFDHELSKYPCHNYVANGFCSRQESCLFSHKILAKEGNESTIDASKFECKSMDPPNKSTTKQAGHSSQKAPSKEGAGSAVPEFQFKSLASSNKPNTKHHVNLGTFNFAGTNTATITKGYVPISTSDQQVARKGFSLFGKPLVDASAKQREMGSSSRSDNVTERSGTQPTQGTEKGPQAILPPRGITFLSFGETSPVDNRGKLAGLSTNKEKDSSVHDMEIYDKPLSSVVLPNGLVVPAVSPGSSSTMSKDASKGVTFRKFSKISPKDGHGGTQASLTTQIDKDISSSIPVNGSGIWLQLPNTMPHGQPDHPFFPALSLKNLDDNPGIFAFQSSGKTSSVATPDGKQPNSPPMTEKGLGSSLDMGSSGKLQGNAVSQGLSGHPFSFGLGSKKLEDVQARVTPSSAPRALSSTLAFAAKLESVIRRNPLSDTTASSSQLIKSADSSSSSGSATADRMKPIAIHDLLFGGNGCTK